MFFMVITGCTLKEIIKTMRKKKKLVNNFFFLALHGKSILEHVAWLLSELLINRKQLRQRIEDELSKWIIKEITSYKSINGI